MKELWALSERGKAIFESLLLQKIDRELAFEVVLKILKEEEAIDLPPKDDERETG